jgi:hypothetical protein
MEFSMEFHQPHFHKIPWNSMENSMEFHGKFNGIPLNSMEFHGKYNEKNPSNVYKKIHGIPWKIP